MPFMFILVELVEVSTSSFSVYYKVIYYPFCFDVCYFKQINYPRQYVYKFIHINKYRKRIPKKNIISQKLTTPPPQKLTTSSPHTPKTCGTIQKNRGQNCLLEDYTMERSVAKLKLKTSISIHLRETFIILKTSKCSSIADIAPKQSIFLLVASAFLLRLQNRNSIE